jgi:phosphotransferase system HPr-like phosphotransfer protein
MDKHIKIRLQTVEDVKEFVTVAEKYPGNIRVHANDYIVSGKSIMGMFSLDLSNPVIVEVDNRGSVTDFESTIAEFLA